MTKKGDAIKEESLSFPYEKLPASYLPCQPFGPCTIQGSLLQTLLTLVTHYVSTLCYYLSLCFYSYPLVITNLTSPYLYLTPLVLTSPFFYLGSFILRDPFPY